MPEKGQDSQASDRDSGTNSRASFANFDLDSSSWKTSQRCLLEGWTPYSEPWPRSGMTRNGRAYERPTWVRGIDGNGCSSSRGEPKMGVDSWATPTASDGLAETLSPGMGARERGPQNLMECVAKAVWMTPTTRDWKDGACADSDVPTNGLLGRQAVRTWPTPDASVANDTEELESRLARRERVRETASNGNGMGTPLAVAARLWPTTTAGDARASSSETSDAHDGTSLTDATVRAAPTKGLKLNPSWVEQLMGFPPGWTLLGPASPKPNGKRPASSRKRKTGQRASKPSETQSSRKSPSSSGDGC